VRLTCPNCKAQYEVPEEDISPGGRDVQCSNCETTWFALAPPSEPDPSADRSAAPRFAPAPREEAEAEDDPPRQPEIPRPDPAVMSVLREERAFEDKAREDDRRWAGQRAAAEDGADDEALAERRRLADAAALGRARAGGAELRDGAAGRQQGSAAGEAAPRPAGSARFPDVDRIAPGAEAGTGRGGEDTTPPQEWTTYGTTRRKGSGFRIGVVIALILLAIALALYLFADPVAEAMPEAAPVVSSYVEFVQSARVDLATRITVLSERIAPAQP
jgi:predicted Zn finger-like uncharacterized protein